MDSHLVVTKRSLDSHSAVTRRSLGSHSAGRSLSGQYRWLDISQPLQRDLDGFDRLEVELQAGVRRPYHLEPLVEREVGVSAGRRRHHGHQLLVVSVLTAQLDVTLDHHVVTCSGQSGGRRRSAEEWHVVTCSDMQWHADTTVAVVIGVTCSDLQHTAVGVVTCSDLHTQRSAEWHVVTYNAQATGLRSDDIQGPKHSGQWSSDLQLTPSLRSDMLKMLPPFDLLITRLTGHCINVQTFLYC